MVDDRSDGSEEELDCLPDVVGKYAHVGKPLGAWKPQAKKDSSGADGYHQGVSERALTPESRRKYELLQLLGDETVLSLGGGAVRSGCSGFSPEGYSRALRERLQSSARAREKKDLFGALRWMVAALGLCRSVKRRPEASAGDAGRDDVQSPPAAAQDIDMVEQVTKAYHDLRARITAQIRSGSAVPSKAEVEAHHHAGCVAREKNDLQTALKEFKEVLRLQIACVGEAHPETALARSHVATVIRDMGNLKGAMAELKKALKIQEAALGEGHPHVAITRNNIGAVLKHQGKSEEALNEHRKALVILVTYYGEKGMKNKYMAEVYEHIGHALRIQSDIFAALVGYEVALQIRKKILPGGGTHPKSQRIMQKMESLEACWTGLSRSMMKSLRADPADTEWNCPSCKWRTTLDICSCCSYRRPLSKDGIPQFFKGMTFAFTGMIPKPVHASAWGEWRLAEQHGAVCSEDVEEGVTHLIYREGYERSGKVQHAQQLNIKVLLADWFYQSVNLGVALDEGPFLAEQGHNRSLTTKKLAHVRPGGGTERAQSCPPWRCILAPPRHRSYQFTEKLPGPQPLMELTALSPKHLVDARGAGGPASPRARRPQLDGGDDPMHSPSPHARVEISARHGSAFKMVSRPKSCSLPLHDGIADPAGAAPPATNEDVVVLDADADADAEVLAAAGTDRDDSDNDGDNDAEADAAGAADAEAAPPRVVDDAEEVEVAEAAPEAAPAKPVAEAPAPADADAASEHLDIPQADSEQAAPEVHGDASSDGAADVARDEDDLVVAD